MMYSAFEIFRKVVVLSGTLSFCAVWCRLYFISFGTIEPILVILKIEYRFGAYPASQTTVLQMKRLNQTEFSDFRDFVYSLLPKAILFDFLSK